MNKDYMGCEDSYTPLCLIDKLFEGFWAIVVVIFWYCVKILLKTTGFTYIYPNE